MGFAARVKLQCCFSPQKSSNRSLISGEYKQLRPHPPHRHAHCQSCPIFPSHRDLSYASQTSCSRFLNHILPAMTEIRNQLPNCRRYHKPSLNPEVCLRNVAGKPPTFPVALGAVRTVEPLRGPICTHKKYRWYLVMNQSLDLFVSFFLLS